MKLPARLSLALVLACSAAMAVFAVGDAPAVAAKRCPGASVGGKRVCLHVGRQCKPRNRPDYLQAGFDCRRRTRRFVLARASAIQRRQGRPLDLGPSGRPTFAQALAAFDRFVAPLPGVTPAPGTVGNSPSGSRAIAWLQGYRGRLTRGQRAVLDRVLSQPGSALVTAADATTDQFVTIIRDAQALLRARGMVFVHPIEVRVDARPPGGAAAYTVPKWLSGTGETCQISIERLAVAATLRKRRLYMTHELMHCALAERTASLEEDRRIPAWVGEGLPEWGAYRVVADWMGPFAEPRSWWSIWLRENPQTDLFRRQYDALGFWALLEHEGVDLWSLIPAIVSDAGSFPGTNEAVYRLVTTRTAGDYAGEWGSTSATQAAAGRRWDLDGPGMPAPALERATIDDDATWGRTFGPRGGYAAQLDLAAEVIAVQRTPGTVGFLRDAAGADQTVPGDERFCAKPGGCRCANGQELPFPPISRGTAYIGVADQTGRGAVLVSGESVEKHCPEGARGRGIVMFRKSVAEGVPVVADFRSGACRVLRGGRFVAESSSGPYRLYVVISPFHGYRPYALRFRSAEPFFEVTGPGVAFSNLYFPPGATPPGAGGGIAFGNHGRGMSLGFFNAFDHDYSDSVTLAGAMTCNRRGRLSPIPRLPS